jgi:hypothetical protein
MLAIVIPYYKLTFFEETLKSLADQTDKRFKVYIGDDASLENPLELLEKYKGKFQFKYKRFENNLGGISLVQQWERCIAMVDDEEWIQILGDDDVLGNNVVEEFYKNTPKSTNEINVIRFLTQKIDEKGLPISIIYKHPEIEKATDFLFRKTRSSLSEYIFRKKQVIDIGFKDFPLAWFSDVLAVLEFSNFKDIFSINNSLVSIRISEFSISGNKTNLTLKSKATFEFYYYLLTIKKDSFTNVQRDDLLLKINKCYINDKRKIFLFLNISKIYISNFLFMGYFSFLKSIIVSEIQTNQRNLGIK